MKKLSLVFAAAVMLVAQSVSAQTYAPLSMYYPTPTACVSITRDLSVGSRGTDVESLQRFIVSRNYPGGGTWMITSYFGAATRAGVINFQMDSRLPQTGFLDAGTRAALSQKTCGTSYPTPTYPTNPWYPTTPTNPTNPTPWNPTPCTWYTQGGYSYNTCGNNNANNSTLSISYLSPNSGSIGTSVTVYGSGFSYSNNSVRFGNGIIAGLSSSDGRTISFTVPATLSGYGSSIVTPGVYNVTVTNSSGATSNTTSFTVNSYGNNYSAPTINSVSGPTNLALNTQGTWTLNITNNQTNSYVTTSVNWGDSQFYGASLSPVQTTYAQGSQTQTFTHTYANSGTYTAVFKVTGANGLSNTYTATVNVSGTSNNSVVISNISPTSVRVGQQVLLSGNGFNGDNTVRFGVGGLKGQTSMSGNYIYYTIPQYVSPCDIVATGSYCAQYQQQVVPGQYQIYVTNSNGTSNTLTISVVQ